MVTASAQNSTTPVPAEVGLRLQQLGAELAEVKRSVEALLPLGGSQAQPANHCPADVMRNHRQILELTAELFPGAGIEVEEAIDPEIAGEPYLVINVATSGAVNEVVAKHREWHLRIWDVAPQTAHAYRLLLDVQ